MVLSMTVKHLGRGLQKELLGPGHGVGIVSCLPSSPSATELRADGLTASFHLPDSSVVTDWKLLSEEIS